MRKLVFVAAVMALAGVAMQPQAAAARYCEGTVRGISGNYNPATGSGFLAVRAGPRAAATQIGELFGGDRVEILGRQGNWYNIDANGLEGWASARYIRNSCR